MIDKVGRVAYLNRTLTQACAGLRANARKRHADV